MGHSLPFGREQNVRHWETYIIILALFTQWTNKKSSKKVFHSYPRGTYVNFKIGYASHQKGEIEESFSEDVLALDYKLIVPLYQKRNVINLTMPLLKFQKSSKKS